MCVHPSYPKKTIEIINPSDVSIYILEFIFSFVLLGFMVYTSRKRTKETDSTIK